MSDEPLIPQPLGDTVAPDAYERVSVIELGRKHCGRKVQVITPQLTLSAVIRRIDQDTSLEMSGLYGTPINYHSMVSSTTIWFEGLDSPLKFHPNQHVTLYPRGIPAPPEYDPDFQRSPEVQALIAARAEFEAKAATQGWDRPAGRGGW